jgi:hypothetical protein
MHASLATLAMVPTMTAVAQSPKYPAIGEYLMDASAEIVLARTGAPPNVSDRATIKVLHRDAEQEYAHGVSLRPSDSCNTARAVELVGGASGVRRTPAREHEMPD